MTTDTGGHAPIIMWFRRDLRLSDHPALRDAAGRGRPVLPVFIRDERVDGLGAAPKWRLGQSVDALAEALEGQGLRLVLRSGSPLDVLRRLVSETGAERVVWSRLYDPQSQEVDSAVKAGLKEDGLDAESFPGHLMFEPWTVETGGGGPYKVFSPFWKAVRKRDVRAAEAAPSRLRGPGTWPDSEALDDWGLGNGMNRAAPVLARYTEAGEAAAQRRLEDFVEEDLARYGELRNRFDEGSTSGLSAHLSLGEIGPATCWHRALRARQNGVQGAEHFLRQLVWREFAYHLMYHTPEILDRAWRPEWKGFPWDTAEDSAEVTAWKQGRTGVPLVDAAMREMWVTGRMHNRGRMVAASYLTKNLLADWRIGMRWFEEHLTDWDPANNAMGWQWVAGCGPDAAPYFRIFNPLKQQKDYDPSGGYVGRWIAEGQDAPPRPARDFFEVVPRAWGLSPDAGYPDPVVDLPDSRKRALAAHERFKSGETD